MPGPLSGIRILDLTSMVSGPMATMVLADQGADVIKVEPPAGDRMRGLSRSVMTGAFMSSNRNKRSLCVDLKRPEGLAIVKKLAERADVFVQNFRPGAIERMGLGEAVLRELRPDLIYVSISGFGESGPFAHQRVYDPVIQALSGLADIQADSGTRRPRMVRTIVPDKTTAVTAAQAITAALLARERGAGGQHVRLAMLDAMVAFLWPEGMSWMNLVDREEGPTQINHDMIYETSDGFITAAAISDSEWQGLCRALGREEWLELEHFASLAGRFEHREERVEMTARELKGWRRADILARLDEHQVPAAPVLRREELLDHPQVLTNELIEIHDHAELGRVRQPRPAARFENTPSSIRQLAPRLGEHNADVLAELGYSEEQRRDLDDHGVTIEVPRAEDPVL